LVQQEDNEINDEAFKPLYPSGLLWWLLRIKVLKWHH
jgi:hypothetical protein